MTCEKQLFEPIERNRKQQHNDDEDNYVNVQVVEFNEVHLKT